MAIDEGLKRFATQRQWEYYTAVDETTGRGAAEKFSVSERTVWNSITALKRKAALQGYSPEHDMTHTAPETHAVKGTSTLYNEEGNVQMQWVKTNLKLEDKLKQIVEFAEALAEEVKGKAKPVKAPKVDTKNQLATYIIGDQHLGMYSWGEETGEDYDTEIARALLVGATERLVASSPACREALILNLGDFFHMDSAANETARSGARLDVDSRWSRVIRLGAEVMKSVIGLALAKHRKVEVRNNIGNHDDHTSQALGLILEAYYSKEPRVTIQTSPNPYWYRRFGKVLLATTHGNTAKPNDLAHIMAADRAQDWGETLYRYFHCGHFHIKAVHEIGGVSVEYHRSLTTADHWTHDKGYRSGREMKAVIYHCEYGEEERHLCGPRRIQAESEA